MKRFVFVLSQLLATTAWSQDLMPLPPTIQLAPVPEFNFQPEFDMPERTVLPEVPDSGTYPGGLVDPFIYLSPLCDDGQGFGQPQTRPEIERAFAGAAAFFSYHCPLFEEAAAALMSAPPGTETPLLPEITAFGGFASLTQELALLALHIEIGADPTPRLARAAEITRIRLLGDDVEALPGVTLSVASAGTPTGQPLALPLPDGFRARHAELMRATVTASTQAEVDSLRFSTRGAEVRIVGPEGCTLASCVVPVMGGQASVTYEFEEPLPDHTTLEQWADLTIHVEAWHEGTWQEAASERTSLQFARCNAALTEELTHATLYAEIRDRLFALTLPIEGMTGQRLTDDPQYPSSPDFGPDPEFHPGDIDDLQPDPRTATLAAHLDEVAEMRGLDLYLAANSDMTGGLHEAIGGIDDFRGMTRCSQPEREAAIARIEDQLTIVRRNLDLWELRHLSAESGAYNWRLRYERGMNWFDATRMTEGEPLDPTLMAYLTEVGVDSSVFRAQRSLVGIIRVALNYTVGPETAGEVMGPAAIFTAIRETIRVGEALMDLETLFDLRAEMREALGWMEMEAYFRILVARYQLAEEDLVLARDRLQEHWRRNCICWQPPAG
jgi:hypothetical protein